METQLSMGSYIVYDWPPAPYRTQSSAQVGSCCCRSRDSDGTLPNSLTINHPFGGDCHRLEVGPPDVALRDIIIMTLLCAPSVPSAKWSVAKSRRLTYDTQDSSLFPCLRLHCHLSAQLQKHLVDAYILTVLPLVFALRGWCDHII